MSRYINPAMLWKCGVQLRYPLPLIDVSQFKVSSRLAQDVQGDWFSFFCHQRRRLITDCGRENTTASLGRRSEDGINRISKKWGGGGLDSCGLEYAPEP